MIALVFKNGGLLQLSAILRCTAPRNTWRGGTIQTEALIATSGSTGLGRPYLAGREAFGLALHGQKRPDIIQYDIVADGEK